MLTALFVTYHYLIIKKEMKFIIKELNKWKDFKEGPDGTLISFGCFSECFDKKSKRNHLFN